MGLLFLLFLLSYLLSLKYAGFISLSSLLIFIYLLSTLVSLFLVELQILNYDRNEIDFSAVMFYWLMIVCVTIPFYSANNVKIEAFSKRKELVFNYIIRICSITSIISIVLSSRLIYFVLTSSAIKADFDRVVRSYNFSTSIIEDFGLFLLSLFSNFYILFLTSAAYYFVSNYKDRYILLPLTASFATIFNALRVGGRTEIIYWLFGLLTVVVFFWKYIDFKKKMRVFKFAMIGIALLYFYNLYISFSRFDDSSTYNTAYSISPVLLSNLDYMGQQFVNYNDFWLNYRSDNITLARLFPLINSLVNGNFDLNLYRNQLSMDIGVFYTFLGDLFVDVGAFGTTIYVFIFIFLAFTLRTKKKFDLIDLVLYLFLFLIPFNGLFYYSLWQKGSTYFVLFLFIIKFILKVRRV